MNTDELVYETPHGDGRILQRRAPRPWAALVLTHGAGGGIDSHDLVALQRRLPAHGISVALVEMPWKRAGRRVAPSPRILDECFRSLTNHLRPRSSLFVGGRSAG
ncbi:MAG: alpha/beta family hydrolase, partial [Nocardioidaceae bacterium]